MYRTDVKLAGVNWEKTGTLSGVAKSWTSKYGSIGAYRQDPDFMLRITNKDGVARFFIFSNFASDFEEFSQKREEYVTKVAEGLVNGFSTDDIIASMKNDEITIKETNPGIYPSQKLNIKGYHWRYVVQSLDTNWNGYDRLWETAPDKFRPQLKIRLRSEDRKNYILIYADSEGEKMSTVSQEIDNEEDALKVAYAAMEEWSIAHASDFSKNRQANKEQKDSEFLKNGKKE